MAVVKWEGYGFKHVTREPVESLKLNPNIVPEIQRLETQYKIKKQSKFIEHQIEQEKKALQQALFPHVKYGQEPKEKKVKQESGEKLEQSREKIEKSGESLGGKKRKKNELTDGQIALCKVEA